MKKVCSKCKEEKSLESFSVQNDGSMGRRCACKFCLSVERREKYHSDPAHKEKAKLKAQQFRDNHPNYVREWDLTHKESRLATFKKYRETHREETKLRCRKYQKEHPAVFAHHAAQRRALEKRASSPVHDAALKEIYRNCPPGYHVDHIVPLNGKTVSGLHVPCNLQYLPAVENLKKGSKLISQGVN